METFRICDKISLQILPELWTINGVSFFVSEAQWNESCACGYWKLALAQIILEPQKRLVLLCVIVAAGLRYNKL